MSLIVFKISYHNDRKKPWDKYYKKKSVVNRTTLKFHLNIYIILRYFFVEKKTDLKF